jgi:hypothetical protein
MYLMGIEDRGIGRRPDKQRAWKCPYCGQTWGPALAECPCWKVGSVAHEQRKNVTNRLLLEAA